MSYPVQFSQIFLLLLVHHNVHTSDRFANHSDLAQLGGCTTSNFSHLKAAKFGFQVIELFG